MGSVPGMQAPRAEEALCNAGAACVDSISRERSSKAAQEMTDYQRCPFCAGHEQVSIEAARTIGELVHAWIVEHEDDNTALNAEMYNIYNSLENMADREEPQREEYAPPVCPTPNKRTYFSLENTHHDAVRWNRHPYECECGYWHLSKLTPAAYVGKLSSPAASAEEFDEVEIDPLLT
jgi:hypothetical protein